MATRRGPAEVWVEGDAVGALRIDCKRAADTLPDADGLEGLFLLKAKGARRSVGGCMGERRLGRFGQRQRGRLTDETFMAPPAATFATALEAMVQALYETWVGVGGSCRVSRRKSALKERASQPGRAEAALN